MDDELRRKLEVDLQKSGFGSEMRALRSIRDASAWKATGSVHYIDLDVNAMRESDIEAHHVLTEPEEADDLHIDFQSFYSLSIEVKKSEKPWIAFKEKPNYTFELMDGSHALAFCGGVKHQFRKGIQHTLSMTGLARVLGWYGNGIHEAFKNPDQPSRWYSSFVSVCKAAEYELTQNSWPLKATEDDDNYPYLWVSKPVVVLDGILLSAELDASGALQLSEEEMCAVKFAYTSANYNRRKYFVDVVKLDALPKYLTWSEARNQKLFSSLQKISSYKVKN